MEDHHEQERKSATDHVELHPFLPATENSTVTTSAAATEQSPPFSPSERNVTTSDSATVQSPPLSPSERKKFDRVCGFVCMALLGLPLMAICWSFGSPDKLQPPKFQVDTMTVLPFNISSTQLTTQLTTNWVVAFSVKNPNHLDYQQIYCDDVTASIFYKDTNISSMAIKPFLTYQNQKVSVPVNMGPTSVNINGSVAGAIIEDWSRGAVNFSLIFNATARINPWSNNGQEERALMSVSCGDIRIEFFPSMKFAGTMSGGSSKCKAQFVS